MHGQPFPPLGLSASQSPILTPQMSPRGGGWQVPVSVQSLPHSGASRRLEDSHDSGGVTVPESLLARIAAIVTEMEHGMEGGPIAPTAATTTNVLRELQTVTQPVTQTVTQPNWSNAPKGNDAEPPNEKNPDWLKWLRAIEHRREASEASQMCQQSLAELRRMADTPAPQAARSRGIPTESVGSEEDDDSFHQERHLRRQLADSQASCQRHERMAAQAIETRAAAEANLHSLEAHAEQVLGDCRQLQDKLDHVQVTPNKRVEEDLASMKQHEAQLSSELAERDRECERLRGDLDDSLKCNEEARAMELELQRNLIDARTAAHTAVEAAAAAEAVESAERRAADRERMEELEHELAETLSGHGRNQQQHRSRIVELEQQIETAHASNEEHTRRHAAFSATIADLEGRLSDAHATVDEHVQHRGTLHANVTDLEQRLLEARSAGEQHHSQHGTLLQTQGELERHLQEAAIKRHQLEEHLEETSIARRQLEDQLQEATIVNQQLAQRTEELESELEQLTQNARDMADADTKNIAALEEMLAQERETRADLERRLEERETQHGGQTAEPERIVHLQQQVEEERRVNETLQRRMDELLLAQDAVKQNLEHVSNMRLEELRLEMQKQLEDQLEMQQHEHLRSVHQMQQLGPQVGDSTEHNQQLEVTSLLPTGSIGTSRSADKHHHHELDDQQGRIVRPVPTGSLGTARNLEKIHHPDVPLARPVQPLPSGSLGALNLEQRHHLQEPRSTPSQPAPSGLLNSSMRSDHTLQSEAQLGHGTHTLPSGQLGSIRSVPASASAASIINSGALGTHAFMDAQRLGFSLGSVDERAGVEQPSILQVAAAPRPVELSPAYEQVLQNVESSGWDSVEWRDGYTMLHMAAAKGRIDICKYVLEFRASLDLRDKYGRTPFDCAKEGGHRDTARILEELGGKSQRGPSGSGRAAQALGTHPALGNAPMGSVARVKRSSLPPGYLEVMDKIDSVGWSGMQWEHGFTLLHYAAKNNNAELCARFLAQGGDPHHRDDNGKSALDYARESGATAAMSVLEREPPLI